VQAYQKVCGFFKEMTDRGDARNPVYSMKQRARARNTIHLNTLAGEKYMAKKVFSL